VNGTISRKNVLSALAGFGLAAAAVRPADASSRGVTGAWKLESFDMLLRGGKKQPRYGSDPVGYLIYTPSGRVSATLQAAHRASLNVPGATPGSETHCEESVTSFLAYAGTYSIRGNRVFHKLETCVFTSLVGTTLEREFDLAGDTLTIKTVPPFIWGNQSILVWRRA